jgi:hypothetical protein
MKERLTRGAISETFTAPRDFLPSDLQGLLYIFDIAAHQREIAVRSNQLFINM